MNLLLRQLKHHLSILCPLIFGQGNELCFSVSSPSSELSRTYLVLKFVGDFLCGALLTITLGISLNFWLSRKSSSFFRLNRFDESGLRWKMHRGLIQLVIILGTFAGSFLSYVDYTDHPFLHHCRIFLIGGVMGYYLASIKN